jgi:hypothetical protein
VGTSIHAKLRNFFVSFTHFWQGIVRQTYLGIAKTKVKLNHVLLYQMGNPMKASLYPVRNTDQQLNVRYNALQ